MKAVANFLVILITIFLIPQALANGVLRNGIGSKSIGLAGSDLVFADNGLSAMNSNPAALTKLKGGNLVLSGTVATLDAEYSNGGSSVNADSSPGFIPEFAYTRELNNGITMGLSVVPISTLDAGWDFLDPADGNGTSFGNTRHKSSYIVVRSAVGAGYQVNDRLSVGASIGLLYNRNRLKSPYTFQSHPVLSTLGGGAKVTADLETDGFGVNGVFSLNYQATNSVLLSLSYTTPSSFDTEGDIKGTLPLGLGFYSYDAEVETELPQIIQAGINWQVQPGLRVGFQLDWIDWSNAFEKLPLHLTNGSNAALNGVLGSNRIDDTTPLNWDDSFVFHFGTEYKYSSSTTLRFGYSYGENPVPATTATPMSSAIMENTLALGAGFDTTDYLIDVGYAWDLPTDININNSQLVGGAKYNGGNVDVSIHWFSVSLSFKNL
ncbi:MAG: outer membrane protein transport protein [Gammaproteobacteria bacterium]